MQKLKQNIALTFRVTAEEQANIIRNIGDITWLN